MKELNCDVLNHTPLVEDEVMVCKNFCYEKISKLNFGRIWEIIALLYNQKDPLQSGICGLCEDLINVDSRYHDISHHDHDYDTGYECIGDCEDPDCEDHDMSE